MMPQWIKTAHWKFIILSLILLLTSILLIVNANCSKPYGISAEALVCVGGQLSIQSWLVIVGLEFGFLGYFLFPRIAEVLISKVLTRGLAGDGMSFASLLNSQRTAPWKTQMRFGLKRVLGIRILGVVIILVFSILYKYSFVRVERYSSFTLDDTQKPIILGCNGGGCNGGVSDNFAGALSGTMGSSSNISFNPGSPMRAKQYTQVYGPSQPAWAPQLKTGTEFLCTPTYYSRNKIYPNDQFWTPLVVGTDVYNNGVRFFDTSGGTLVDVYSANGTLQILSAKYGSNATTCYTSKLTAMVSVCVGYASWSVNNTITPEALLQDPEDIDCYQENFDLISWANSPGAQFTLNLLGGLGSKNINNLPQSTAAMNVILASLNHSAATNILERKVKANLLANTVKTAMPAECSSSTASHPWVVSGVSYNNGTGMTLLGAVLQGLVLLFTLLALLLLFWPTSALLTEWPAQWLVLACTMEQAKVQEAVENTSFGRNEVDGELWMNMTTENDKRVSKSPKRNSLMFNAEVIETKRISYRRRTEDGLKRLSQVDNGGPSSGA
ncbi:hypothetical protein GLAREA_06306 [Glarea lozoyensis ATCC 20868]|uniref:Uncharacterized protein n=1 Tax=Glarea lozoyensis (strain ATCC 20868 / MF5171) TaxID=1116229 RepID=S3D871_GLAL2|nr:uncharacterized protein GLAREA_06306 [Glarea lozoyensis ATCC 20868]EPE33294.1 hypothetical protein GLAREA_06306 [Glarea lozoyensis ATCC 20868]